MDVWRHETTYAPWNRRVRARSNYPRDMKKQRRNSKIRKKRKERKQVAKFGRKKREDAHGSLSLFHSPDKAFLSPTEALHSKQEIPEEQPNLPSRALFFPSPSDDENVPLPIDQASSSKWSRAPHGVAAEPTNQRRGRAHVVSLDPWGRRQCKLSVPQILASSRCLQVLFPLCFYPSLGHLRPTCRRHGHFLLLDLAGESRALVLPTML
ncbi:hypothetical protein ACQKWADRAFT_184836 [Trichoderma austrokoningii]